MKTLPMYYTTSGTDVDAYTLPELREGKVYDLLKEAEEIMYDAWRANGREDAGSCVLGAGIEVWHVKPRARIAKPLVVIRQVAQGNVSSHSASQPAIEFLREQGINARWNDGRLD